MADPQQPNGAGAPASEEQRNFSALDAIIGETERAAKDRIIVRRAELDYHQRLARAFAQSGCFADIKDTREEVVIARALVKIKLGESMGFSEAESMTGIDIIQGRVAVGASLRAARMQRVGFSWPQMICTNKGCWVPLVFKGEPMMQQRVDENGELLFHPDGRPVMTQVVVSFTEKDAVMAGLSGKDNYRKDPSSMYFARSITRAQRRYGPGVLGVDVLDTYEARDLPPDREIASLSLDAFRPSADPNRGHDATAANGESETEEEAEPQVIWPDRESMTKAFAAEKKRIGDKEWERIIRESGVMLGAAKCDDPNVLRCYLAMQKAPAKGNE